MNQETDNKQQDQEFRNALMGTSMVKVVCFYMIIMTIATGLFIILDWLTLSQAMTIDTITILGVTIITIQVKAIGNGMKKLLARQGHLMVMSVYEEYLRVHPEGSMTFKEFVEKLSSDKDFQEQVNELTGVEVQAVKIESK